MAIFYDESFTVALGNDQLAFDQIAASEETKEAIARLVKRQKERQGK